MKTICNTISLLTLVTSLVFSVLWYKKIVEEPTVAVISASASIVLFISGLILDDKSGVSSSKRKATHSGTGDNVLGDKIINSGSGNITKKTK